MICDNNKEEKKEKMSVVNGAPDPFFTGLHKCRYHFTEQRRDFCDKVLAIGNAIVDIHISVFA